MKSILIICLAVLLAIVPVLHSSVVGTEANESEWLSGTGRWVPYTVDFIGLGPFIADDEQYSAILPTNINSGDGIQFNCGGHWFSYELSGGKIQWWYIDKGKESTKSIGSILSSQGAASGNNVTYQNAFWGTDIRYTAHSYGLREVFILDVLPSGASVDWDETYLEYTGELTWDDGLSVWADGVEHPDKTFRTSGNIDFRDVATNESVFYIPAPTAWDSGDIGERQYCELVYDVKVSAGKIQYGLRVPYEFLAAAVFPVYIDPDNWVSPTGHNDLDAWSSEALAYDGNTGTVAYTSVSGGELELTIGAILCDKIRLYAHVSFFCGIYDPNVTISVYYDFAYHQIFSGYITKDTWVEKSIGNIKVVTKAKISGILVLMGERLELCEFQFNSLPPTVETDACSGVQSTSFDGNGDITKAVAGSVTKRGFHYSKVFDGFEWGSDGDPLSDSGGAITWTTTAAGTSKAEIDTAQHHTGTRSARLYRDGTNMPKATFSQSPITASQSIHFWFRKDGTSQPSYLHGNGSHIIYVIVGFDEKVYYFDGSGKDTGATVLINTWYSLSIRNVNWAAHTYDIYLNGVLIKSGAVMLSNPGYSGTVTFVNELGTSEYWLDEVAVWDVEDEDGSFGEGEYSLEITGLDPSTTYYVQAFAKNAAGFGYGNVVSQLTLTQAGYSWGSIIG